MHDLPAVDCTQLCHLPPTPKAAFNKITGPCTEIKFHDQVHLETCSLYIHIVHASVMEEPSLNNFQAKLQSNFELFQTSITSNLHAIPSLSQPKHTRANSKPYDRNEFSCSSSNDKTNETASCLATDL